MRLSPTGLQLAQFIVQSNLPSPLHLKLHVPACSGPCTLTRVLVCCFAFWVCTVIGLHVSCTHNLDVCSQHLTCATRIRGCDAAHCSTLSCLTCIARPDARVAAQIGALLVPIILIALAAVVYTQFS